MVASSSALPSARQHHGPQEGTLQAQEPGGLEMVPRGPLGLLLASLQAPVALWRGVSPGCCLLRLPTSQHSDPWITEVALPGSEF